MQEVINIKHEGKPYSDRIKYWLSIFIGILFVFYLLFFFKDELDNLIFKVAIIAIILSIYIAFRFRKEKNYLVDFVSDSKNIDLGFFKGNMKVNKKANFNSIEVTLKNTTTRLGFNCELILKIDGKKFIIDRTFDWTFEEMKNLFEYIKHFKNEPLTESDKFNLSKMNVTINKTHHNIGEHP